MDLATGGCRGSICTVLLVLLYLLPHQGEPTDEGCEEEERPIVADSDDE